MQKMLIGLAAMVMSTAAMADTYSLDPAHTYPNFTINHLGFSTIHGRFNATEGTLTMDRAKGTGSVEVVIKADSVDTGHDKRDEHLRGPDFFNAGEFPEITYKSSKVTFSGEKNATVDGTLTILGVSKPVTLKVSEINCGAHPFNKKEMCGFHATTSIKRSDFGVKYGLPAVGDQIDIVLTAEAMKQ
jgi:polyisoprenoid-binding protein YceI